MKPYDGTDAIGVDRWIDRPDRVESAPSVRYRCLDCGYTGRATTAYRHHVSQRPHHRIVDVSGVPQLFSCCKGASK